VRQLTNAEMGLVRAGEAYFSPDGKRLVAAVLSVLAVAASFLIDDKRAAGTMREIPAPFAGEEPAAQTHAAGPSA
jgi:hypothetical protein